MDALWVRIMFPFALYPGKFSRIDAESHSFGTNVAFPRIHVALCKQQLTQDLLKAFKTGI